MSPVVDTWPRPPPAPTPEKEQELLAIQAERSEMRKLWRSASPVRPRQQEGEQVLPVSAPSRGPPQTPHLGVLLNNLLVRANDICFSAACASTRKSWSSEHSAETALATVLMADG